MNILICISNKMDFFVVKVLLVKQEFYKFYDIKFKTMDLTKRYIELETKTDEESIREKKMINEKFEELDDRLNVLL